MLSKVKLISPDTAMSANSQSGPSLPPLLKGHACLPGIDPVSVALEGAASGSFGAGDLLWSLDTHRAAAAVVLEPEIPLEKAAVMPLVMMVAIGDALGAIGPPNLGITFRWPFTILANGAGIGEASLRFPADADPKTTPSFIVVGFDLALEPDPSVEPGEDYRHTALHLEGCGDIGAIDILEAVARHFTAWVDTFGESGFASAHESWMYRADHQPDSEISEPCSGRFIGLDEDGGLLVDISGKTRCFPLWEAAQ